MSDRGEYGRVYATRTTTYAPVAWSTGFAAVRLRRLHHSTYIHRHTACRELENELLATHGGTAMRNLVLSNVIAALLASAATSVASAQERNQPQTDTLAEVVVTGSRIKRAGFETLQPAMVVGADAIADRAIVNVADALKDVPAFGVPGGSPVGG